jgi:hypothetical protein
LAGKFQNQILVNSKGNRRASPGSSEQPLPRIVPNSGNEGAIVVGKIRESKDQNFGYNA